MRIHRASVSESFAGMVRSAHFWIIIAIIVIISFIYYELSFMYHARPETYRWFWIYSLIEFQHNAIGTLYLIPISYAAFFFWWRGTVIAWSLSFISILPHIIYYSFTTVSLVSNVSYSLIPLAVVIAINAELRWREGEKRILTQREEERQLYMLEILKAQENERKRIACELHDGSIQELLMIANKVEGLLVHNPRVKDDVELGSGSKWIEDRILQVSQDLRSLSLELRPDVLDTMGLLPALRWLASRLKKEHRINTSVIITGVQRKVNPQTEVMVFRIVQEALNNVRWHADASKAVVTVSFTPNLLKINIKDDGKGFLVSKISETKWIKEGRLGILGMQQRTKLLNGTFDINSKPGMGTSVSIELPD